MLALCQAVFVSLLTSLKGLRIVSNDFSMVLVGKSKLIS